MWQATDTASLGMSSRMTEPPLGLLTHLQSLSGEVMEAGAGNNESAICGNKIKQINIFSSFMGLRVILFLCCAFITGWGQWIHRTWRKWSLYCWVMKWVVLTVYHVRPCRTIRCTVQSDPFIRLRSLGFSLIGICTLYGSLTLVFPLVRVTSPQFMCKLSMGIPYVILWLPWVTSGLSQNYTTIQ